MNTNIEIELTKNYYSFDCQLKCVPNGLSLCDTILIANYLIIAECIHCCVANGIEMSFCIFCFQTNNIAVDDAFSIRLRTINIQCGNKRYCNSYRTSNIICTCIESATTTRIAEYAVVAATNRLCHLSKNGIQFDAL